MTYEILLAPEAVDDLRRLKAHLRAEVRDAMMEHLRNEPMKTSRSRIKRLRDFHQPQYRLRVGDIRVFYDVVGAEVAVLAVVNKTDADAWLNQWGEKE